MRPLFTNRMSHPIRSRFSAFAFSAAKPATRGTERLSDEETPHLSGKTLISTSSTTTKPHLHPSHIDPLKSSPYERSSIHRDPPLDTTTTTASAGAGARGDDASSPVEPWGQNIGATGHRSDSQPWGQNIGAGNGTSAWELDVIPLRPAGLVRGPTSDGRVERWVGG